jgi:predicted nucleic acid-binding protein
MSYLLDTSFLIRLANTADPKHGLAFDALAELLGRNQRLVVTPQVLTEFWSVATRPAGAANGLGMSDSDAKANVEALVAEFPLASDTADIWPELWRLLEVVEVCGKQIHDARLVAVCHAHAIAGVVTFNVRHFDRFRTIPPGLEVVEPSAIVAPSSAAPQA